MNLKINHRLGVVDVKYFNNFSLNLKYDSVGSTFSFGFYFDPTNHDQEELACVSHYHEAIVQHEGETLVTGFILSENFERSPVKHLVHFGGYSKPGVLEDCQIPPSLYPLESNNLSLKEIAQRLIKPFHLNMVIDPAVEARMNIVYPKSTAGETQTIKDYLTELATQRNIIISHNENGDLLFTQATMGLPIADFSSKLIGTKMSLSFSGQGIHSDITVIKQVSHKKKGGGEGNAGQVTIENPYVPVAYTFRPKVITQSSGDDISTLQCAQNALAAELKNIVLTITTDRWEINGKIIRPNNIISVTSPELYLYRKTNWFIESVQFTGNEKEQVAVLTCVLPECYNGKSPKNVFVFAHKNFATEL